MKIISIQTGQDITAAVNSKRTKLFFEKEEANEYAIKKRSYFYPAIHTDENKVETICYCVPK